MGVFFGLFSAVTWGAADFLARLSSERIGARRTLFWMQLFAGFCTAALLLIPAFRPHALHGRTLLFACAIGGLNVVGALMLYRALEIGTVSLVSPISSTFAAVAAGLSIAAGERPSALQLAGLGLAAAGVLGCAAPHPQADGTAAPVSRRGIGLAAGAAVAWGLGFFFLRYVVAELGSVLPVVISRAVSVLVLLVASAALKKPLQRPGAAWPAVAGTAILDSAAFVSYNAGIAGSLTAVVSILSSLFSAVTILLAFFLLKERLGRLQWLAVAVILAGVGLVSSAG